MSDKTRLQQLPLKNLAIIIVAAIVLIAGAAWGVTTYNSAQLVKEGRTLHEGLTAAQTDAQAELENYQAALADVEKHLASFSSTSRRVKNNAAFFAKKTRDGYRSSVSKLTKESDEKDLPEVKPIESDTSEFARDFSQADDARRAELTQEVQGETEGYRELADTLKDLRTELTESHQAAVISLTALVKRLPKDADRIAKDHQDAKKSAVSELKNATKPAGDMKEASVDKLEEQLKEMHSLVKAHVVEGKKVVASHEAVVAERQRAARAASANRNRGNSGGGGQRLCNVWRWAPVGGGYMALEPC